MHTDGVHDPIVTRGSADTRQGQLAPANMYDAARHATGQMPVTALLTEVW